MKRENPTALLSKNLISDALFLLMRKKHPDEITIKELTDEAQVARRTFYQHFSTKYDVMEFRINQILKEYIAKLQTTSIDSAYKFGLVYFSFFKNHAYDISSLEKYGYLDNFVLKIYKKMFEYNNELYQLFGIDSEEDMANYLLVYRYAGTTYVLIEWIKNDFKESPELIASLWASEIVVRNKH